MCGRFTLTRSAAEVAEHFGLSSDLMDEEGAPELVPRYNVAPTQAVAVVRIEDGERRLELRRWGLVPAWAADPSVGVRMINARVESAATRPAFREAWRRRRCLVPADGFYEWRGAAGRRIPNHVTLGESAGLFGIAGLHERWVGPGGEALESVTLLTCEANACIRPLHDRMPLVVAPEAYAAWLDPEREDPRAPASSGQALSAGFRFRRVDPRVNDVGHDDEGCLAEPAPEPQLELF